MNMTGRKLGQLLLAIQLTATAASTLNGDSSLLRGAKTKDEAASPERQLESFRFPGSGSEPPPGILRANPGLDTANNPPPAPTPPPKSLIPATQAPTSNPTENTRDQHPEISGQYPVGDGSTTPFYLRVLEPLRKGAEQIEPLLGANGTYTVEHLVDALQQSYDWETSPSNKKSMGLTPPTDRRLDNATKKSMDFSGELASGVGDLRVAMAHIAVLLGTAWHGGLQNGACDEPNTNATDVNNPGCGQNGKNYRYPFDGFGEKGFGCFNNDQEWNQGTATGCPVLPPVDLIVSDAKENPLTCGRQTSIFSRDCCW